MEQFYSDPSIDEPATTELLVPGTICWYAVTFETLACHEAPTRERVLESVNSRGEDPYSISISCDLDGFLYPEWLPTPATTPREAAAATLAECPASTHRKFQYLGDRGEVGELVTSDFIPARVLCNYDLHRECSGGCGAAPSGGLR
jgi:hypothetical protein